MRIYKMLTPEELPDNLKQVKVVEAQQVVKGRSVKIDPQQVEVNSAKQSIKLNLRINTPHKEQK